LPEIELESNFFSLLKSFPAMSSGIMDSVGCRYSRQKVSWRRCSMYTKSLTNSNKLRPVLGISSERCPGKVVQPAGSKKPFFALAKIRIVLRISSRIAAAFLTLAIFAGILARSVRKTCELFDGGDTTQVESMTSQRIVFIAVLSRSLCPISRDTT
jgi:hypothetical protein